MPHRRIHASIRFLLLSAAIVIGTPVTAATAPDAVSTTPAATSGSSADANTKEISEMAAAVKRAQQKRGAQASQAGDNLKNDIGKDGKMTGTCALVMTSKTGKKTTIAKDLSEATVAHMVKSMPPYMNAAAECATKVKK
jgi:2,4-dienoyl-CoA reductase-like NADH-dependent reductase (Old Yellow Enzyme family)